MENANQIDSVTGTDDIREEDTNERSLAYEILVELKRTTKRQWIVIILLIGVIIGQFSLFTFERLQWEMAMTIEAQQSGEGVNIVCGGDLSYNVDRQE